LATDLDAIRDALVRLWYFGIGGAVPESWMGDDDGSRATLARQAQRVAREAGRRLSAADTAMTAAAAKAEPSIEDYLAGFAAVFERAFRVLPRFTVPGRSDLTEALLSRRQAGTPAR
jgi:hypothetical protein